MELKEALETIKKYCDNTNCDKCEMQIICDEIFKECPMDINIKDLTEE